MEWALERERQLHVQRLEEEVRAGKIRRGPITITQEETDSESEDEWMKNNTQTSNVLVYLCFPVVYYQWVVYWYSLCSDLYTETHSSIPLSH
jgi:hypothetical protein